MTGYYLDASALVKRYADEPGSTWILQVIGPHSQNTVLLAEITDNDLLTAAEAEGLSTDNPVDHS